MSSEDQLQQTIIIDEREARWRAHVAICQAKLVYHTKASAKRAVKRGISKGWDPRSRVYQCRVCEKFHVARK